MPLSRPPYKVRDCPLPSTGYTFDNRSGEAAAALGETPEPAWAKTAKALPILFDEKLGIHTEYSGCESGSSSLRLIVC